MADGDLFSADFDIAFLFARSEAGDYRDAQGDPAIAAVDAPRFDHDAGGDPLGLLIGAGSDLGAQDRVTIDPLILPAEMAAASAAVPVAATVLHHFDSGSGAVRRAWYSRNPMLTVNALLAQAGHHRAIGIVPGFLDNIDGYAVFRGERWRLPGPVVTGGAGLDDSTGRVLISGGAEALDG